MSKNEVSNKNNDTNYIFERRVALGLVCIVIVAFVGFIFLLPEINSTAQAIIRYLAALVAALSAYFFIGSFNLEGSLPLTKIQIRATGAFAVFLIVFFVFFGGIDNSTSHLNNTATEQQLEVVLEIQGELSQISTLVNRYLKGYEVDGLIVGNDIPKLTAVFEDLNAKKGLIGDELYNAFADKGRTLIRLINARNNPTMIQQEWRVYKLQSAEIDRLIEKNFVEKRDKKSSR